MRFTQREFGVGAVDDGANAHAARPQTFDVLRAAAVFDDRDRAHGETATEIRGLANFRDDDPGFAQSRIETRHVCMDLAAKLRARRRHDVRRGRRVNGRVSGWRTRRQRQDSNENRAHIAYEARGAITMTT
jgi:hypothetical protein